MGALGDLLDIMEGKVHLYLTVGKVPAVEITMQGKVIVAEIKNPLLALELGLMQLIKHRDGGDSGMLQKLKKSGLKLKIKYKMLEFEM